MHHSDCVSRQATFTFQVLVNLSPVNIECDPTSQSMCADQAKCDDIHFCCEADLFQTVQRAQRRQTSTLQVRLRVLWCVEAGVVECLKGWRCTVGGVEECGGRGGGV